MTAPRPAGHGWEARRARPAVEPEAKAGLPGGEGRRSSSPRRPFPGEMPWAARPQDARGESRGRPRRGRLDQKVIAGTSRGNEARKTLEQRVLLAFS